MMFYFGTSTLEVDITVTNPISPTRWQRGQCAIAGSALRKAEQRKRNKYEMQANTRGHHFAPLAFETHGRAVLQASGADKRRGGLSATDMMLDLQMTLAKGNAECARTTIARAQACQDERRKRR